jgi:hypothetical protein
MAELNPQLLALFAQQMGQRFTPDMLQGAMLAKGLEEYSKAMKPKQPPGMPSGPAGTPGTPGVPPGGQAQQPPRPPQPQAGGQIAINKQVPGSGPLRSGTTQQQLMALASLLSSPAILQQLARLPFVRPNQPSAAAGIPGVPGPTVQF